MKKLRAEIATIGITDTTEKVIKMRLLNSVAKMVIFGRSKYDIVAALNKQSNFYGQDVQHVVVEVYNLIKDEAF